MPSAMPGERSKAICGDDDSQLKVNLLTASANRREPDGSKLDLHLYTELGFSCAKTKFRFDDVSSRAAQSGGLSRSPRRPVLRKKGPRHMDHPQGRIP